MPIRVFIVDDHAVFRSGLRALLEKEMDLQVVGEAGTGSATLLTVEKLSVDVVILDLSMPEMPGPRVAESLLKQHPKLAIVVLTMHEDNYYLQEMFKIGVRAFVLKKSTGTDLLHAIHVAVRGETYIDPALAGNIVSALVGTPAAKESNDRLSVLTPREKEVCQLLAYGHTNAEIAKKLFISERTVESHRTNIMAKLSVQSRAELVRFALDHGMLSPGTQS